MIIARSTHPLHTAFQKPFITWGRYWLISPAHYQPAKENRKLNKSLRPNLTFLPPYKRKQINQPPLNLNIFFCFFFLCKHTFTYAHTLIYKATKFTCITFPVFLLNILGPQETYCLPSGDQPLDRVFSLPGKCFNVRLYYWRIKLHLNTLWLDKRNLAKNLRWLWSV